MKFIFCLMLPLFFLSTSVFAQGCSDAACPLSETKVLEGGAISSIAEFHQHLASLLEFPDWYGSNLDALFDVLVDVQKRKILIINNASKLKGVLSEDYFNKIVTVFQEARESGSKVSLILNN